MATAAGVTNGCTYLGSAILGWEFGVPADRHGRLAVQWALLALCAAGRVSCLTVRPDLAVFRQRAETDTAMNAPSDNGQKEIKGQKMSKEFADTH